MAEGPTRATGNYIARYVEISDDRSPITHLTLQILVPFLEDIIITRKFKHKSLGGNFDADKNRNNDKRVVITDDMKC